MPRRPPAIPADAVQVRHVEATLVDLSVPALRARDAAAAALRRERLRPADVAAVLRAAGPPT